MKLSVIFASLNDQQEAFATIASIRATAGDKPEIVVVDDCSNTPLDAMIPFEARRGAVIIQNKWRCGCAPSRHIGALAATGEYLLICDSHMRFTEGWYEEAIHRIEGRPKTVHCATCVGFDTQHAETGVYCGGTLNVYGKDRQDPKKVQVIEGVWNPPGLSDDEEMACVMGACYFVNREWFLKLGALRFLRQWGCDEQMLSIKTWLAGGDCRYMKKVEVGHKFLAKGEKQGFIVTTGATTWNKMFAIHTLCPPDLAKTLHEKLKETVTPAEFTVAEHMLRSDWHLVAQEQVHNRRLFVRDFRWLAQKFSLPLP